MVMAITSDLSSLLSFTRSRGFSYQTIAHSTLALNASVASFLWNTASWNKGACQFLAWPYRPETSFFTDRCASAPQPCMRKAECHLNEALITSAIQQSISSTCKFTVWHLQSKNDIKIMEFSIPPQCLCFLLFFFLSFFRAAHSGICALLMYIFYTQFASALWYCSG